MSCPSSNGRWPRLRGVGPALAEQLAKLGVTQVQDLLFVLPLALRRPHAGHAHRRAAPGVRAVVEGEVQLTEVVFRRRRQLLCRISDGSGSLTLRFFYFSGAQQAGLARGTRLRCFGEVRRGPLGLEIVHPEYRRIGQEVGAARRSAHAYLSDHRGRAAAAAARAHRASAARGATRSGVRDWIPRQPARALRPAFAVRRARRCSIARPRCTAR